MELDSFIRIFETFGYPVALSIVLLWAISRFAQRVLENINKREADYMKVRDQQIAYLQMTHTELMGAIRENATAFKDMASTLKRFSIVLEKIEKRLATDGSSDGGAPH